MAPIKGWDILDSNEQSVLESLSYLAGGFIVVAAQFPADVKLSQSGTDCLCLYHHHQCFPSVSSSQSIMIVHSACFFLPFSISSRVVFV